MRLVDSRGRIFGAVNLIDFLILLFLVFFIGMFYFGYQILKNRSTPAVINKESLTLNLQCNFIKVPPEIEKLVSAGDMELDRSGNKIGVINLRKNAEPFQHRINLGLNDLINIKDEQLMQFGANITIKAEVKENQLFYKDSLVSVNSPFYFKTSKYTLLGIPVIEPDLKEKWVNVKAKFNGIFFELSSIIVKGYLEKDNKGRIIGKEMQIINQESSRVSILRMEESKIVFVEDPYRKDILASLDILCVEKADGLYFKNYPVKVGSQINFVSDMYMVMGTIVEIVLNDNK